MATADAPAAKKQKVESDLCGPTMTLTVKGGNDAIAFYEKAFGATLKTKYEDDNKLIKHAVISVGGSDIYIQDEGFAEEEGFHITKAPTTLGGSSFDIYISAKSVDEAFKRAVDAGGKESMKPKKMHWGDTCAKVTDPFGHVWWFGQMPSGGSEHEGAEAEAPSGENGAKKADVTA